jgi:hypothetical protein
LALSLSLRGAGLLTCLGLACLSLSLLALSLLSLASLSSALSLLSSLLTSLSLTRLSSSSSGSASSGSASLSLTRLLLTRLLLTRLLLACLLLAHLLLTRLCRSTSLLSRSDSIPSSVCEGGSGVESLLRGARGATRLRSAQALDTIDNTSLVACLGTNSLSGRARGRHIGVDVGQN